MKWSEELIKYIPVNEQEFKDKELILNCLDKFQDILTRKNIIAHLTGSGFIVNRERTAALMVHHNIYNSWSWTGGHADGEEDLLKVAIKEAQEETGISEIVPIFHTLISLDVIPVKAHYKNKQFVSPHLHLSFAYLLEADDNQPITVKLDENSQVKWIQLDELMNFTASEPHMQVIYNKIINRIPK